ncbi:MAG: hypothetical protein LUC98_02590 [Lachnospiraceae bacterium]|nr:hypothetical protein [Lachnospiraceae bacterium]
MELKQHYEKEVCGIVLICELIQMGRDYTICLWDSRGGHIGSVCMAVARPSLASNGISATSSVLNLSGHKEEGIARRFAEAVAVRENCTAVCNCGIHLDNIRPEQITMIEEACEEFLQEIVRDKI